MTNQDNADNRLGKIEVLPDGRTGVRFERQLQHPVHKVWDALVNPVTRALWFPGFNFEPAVGGEFEIRFGGDHEGPPDVSGEVSAFDPPHLLQCGTMRYELKAHGDITMLTFTDVLNFEQNGTPTEISNSVLGGWHAHMDYLEQMLNGEVVQFDRPELNYAAIEVKGRP